MKRKLSQAGKTLSLEQVIIRIKWMDNLIYIEQEYYRLKFKYFAERQIQRTCLENSISRMKYYKIIDGYPMFDMLDIDNDSKIDDYIKSIDSQNSNEN